MYIVKDRYSMFTVNISFKNEPYPGGSYELVITVNQISWGAITGAR